LYINVKTQRAAAGRAHRKQQHCVLSLVGANFSFSPLKTWPCLALAQKVPTKQNADGALHKACGSKSCRDALLMRV
jgi:hypothetical protein